MKKPNQDIRDFAKMNGICLWQIGESIGMQDYSFSKYLRKELPEAKKQKIIAIIKKLTKKNKKEG